MAEGADPTFITETASPRDKKKSRWGGLRGAAKVAAAAPKPATTPKPAAEEPKPAEPPKPVEVPEPAEPPKPAEVPEQAEPPESAKGPKPAEPSKEELPPEAKPKAPSAADDKAPTRMTAAPQKPKEKVVLPKAGIRLLHDDIVLPPQEMDREAPYAQYTKTHQRYAAAIAAK